MAYQFQFEPVLAHVNLLAEGVLTTMAISSAAIFFGTAIGIVTAAVRSAQTGRTLKLIDAYVEVVRNTWTTVLHQTDSVRGPIPRSSSTPAKPRFL